MARLVLHIGTKKTGSTLIQNSLLKNHERLTAAGWSYPDFTRDRNHAEFALCFQEQRTYVHRKYELDSPELIAAKLSELDKHLTKRVTPGSKWIMSSEFFSTRLLTNAQVAKCVEFLRRHFDEIEVVAVVRRQEYVLPSVYSQYVKAGSDVDWSWEFCEKQRPFFDCAAILERWSGAVGRAGVHVFPFLEDKKRDAHWLMDKFGSITGIPIDSSWEMPGDDGANRSLSAEGIAFLQHTNRYIPRWNPDGSSNLVTRGRAVARISGLTSGPAYMPSSDTLTRIRESYRESNDRLVASLPDRDGWEQWLAQDPVGTSKQVDVPVLEPSRLVELMVEMSEPAGPISWGRVGARPARMHQLASERLRLRTSRAR